MNRRVRTSPTLPIAPRKVDIPNAAKIPPKINQSDIAVLGVKRAMICGLPEVILRRPCCAVNGAGDQDGSEPSFTSFTLLSQAVVEKVWRRKVLQKKLGLVFV